MSGSDPQRRPPPAPAVDAALLAVALMWASTFTLFKVAWRDMDPVAFTAVRFAAMAVLAIVVIAASPSRSRPRREDLPALVLSGVLGYFLYQLGFVLGLDRTTALASAILISTHPIFSVVLDWVVRRTPPNRTELAGVLLGFAGVAVFLRFWDAFAGARPGDLLSLGAAAAFGAYGVVNQRLAQRYSSRELTGYGLAVGGLLVALVGIPAMVRESWTAVTPMTWLILVYAIVGPVYLAYSLWNWAIRHRGIPRTVVYGFLVPVLGGAIAVLALGEQPTTEQAVGGALVLAGLVVTRLRSVAPRTAVDVPLDAEPAGR